ncbi:uncharacterized protein CDAR_297591 [Caerostris darwini]|uniref:Uncharacterized protein n=1 Tax=Caerostris darwini TaxID=1538125 RepID=A0AAV4PKV9_9ARAC|nr:uncharacterized protein CDAR_297591 [Caerostris darwini]
METTPNAKSPALIIKVLLATICMFAGFAGFFLSVWKKNYYAAPACLILELVCVALLQLNSKYVKGQLFQKFSHNTLTICMFIAAFLWAVTLAGSIYFLVSAVKLEQEFYPIKDGFYFALIPCVLANVFSICLIYDSRKFMKMSAQHHANTMHNLS